jgi:ribose 5-phosphate isomerase A
VQRLAQLLQQGALRDILGVPCASSTQAEARRLGVPLSAEDDWPAVDLTIDGADQVDPGLELIKGLGGALLREKLVAQASAREVIVVDRSKLASTLGVGCPLPVEVLAYGWRRQQRFLEDLGARVELRRAADASPYRTDSGNLILDCHFEAIAQPQALALTLQARAGVVAHGLFLGLATDVLIADDMGVEHLRRAPA